jgi:hypothetical protein
VEEKLHEKIGSKRKNMIRKERCPNPTSITTQDRQQLSSTRSISQVATKRQALKPRGKTQVSREGALEAEK